jgi:serine O-acetyltransferase
MSISKFIAGLRHDLDFIQEHDPAAKSRLEILLCYFGLHAVYIHKLSHFFYKSGFFIPARLLSNITRFLTGIEIHPGAKIAPKVFIDHGIGVVIGETAEVEEEVIIYQGVTLGGTSSKAEKRHPTIKRGSVIGSHAQVLGNITVGQNARIGAGSVVVKDVSANTTMVGIPARAADEANKAQKLEHNQIPDVLCDRIQTLENRLSELEKKI